MAFIYQYELVNGRAPFFNLHDNEEIIEGTIHDIFGNRVKETSIELDENTDVYYIQFKLYKSATNGELRKLGKLIKAQMNNYPGIQRRKQKVYFFVEKVDEENNEVHVEIVYENVTHLDVFQQKAEQYFNKLTDKEKHNIVSSDMKNIKNNVYMDVLSAVVDKDIFPNDVKEDECYSVTVQHRKRKYRVDDKDSMQGKYIEIECIPEYAFLVLNGAEENVYDSEIDYFDISSVKKDNGIWDYVHEMLNLGVIPEASLLEEVNTEKTWTFTIHNVGQALATSLAFSDEKPALYFDYGLPYGKNKETKPNGVILPIAKESKIFLSHVDKDHWYGICDNPVAYEVKWLVPEQRSIQFEKICSEIIMAGGQVNTISAGIHSYYDGKIIISCSGNSRHDSSRMPKYKHETGIAIKICGRKLNGEELTILVEGDQDYDYVDDSFLKDIDILVACHHGGKYSWTIYSELPQPRTDESCVIYSYGINNSYGHPSKKNEHNSNGWTNEWDTINGDYSIDVIL